VNKDFHYHDTNIAHTLSEPIVHWYLLDEELIAIHVVVVVLDGANPLKKTKASLFQIGSG